MLLDVLKCLEVRTLHDLKFKARIEVTDGAYVLGVADETGCVSVALNPAFDF